MEFGTRVAGIPYRREHLVPSARALVIFASTGLILDGELVADDPPPMFVYAGFTDIPRPLPGQLPTTGGGRIAVILSLTLAELPGWLALLSRLPADLTFWHQQADLAAPRDIREVMLMELAADDEANRRAREPTRGFREQMAT